MKLTAMLRQPQTMAKTQREILRFTNVVSDERGSERRKPSNLIYDVDEVDGHCHVRLHFDH
jgi:hypothetical protein